MAVVFKSPGKYVQGAGELSNLSKYVKNLGSKFLIVISARNKETLGNEISSGLSEAGYEFSFGIFGGECSFDEIGRLTDIAREEGCDSVIAVGGGKAIDTGKAVGVGIDSTVIIIPTIASNDAPCSGLSVVYNNEGVVKKVIYGKRNPDVVIVDSSILLNSPERLFIAGMGDALSTYFEARACKISGARNMGRGTASNSALAMAKLCYDILIEYGLEAKKAIESGETNQAFENVLEANILLSGVGFESGGLAAAHAINDGFAAVSQAHGALHGEKVAYGTLCQLILEGASKEEYDEVYNFCVSVGLPVKLADLGISEVKAEDIENVAKAACVETQSTKNLANKVTVDDVIKAIYKVNEIGAE